MVDRHDFAGSPGRALLLAFVTAAVHRGLAPGFDPALRAFAIAGIVICLDALVVAPLIERSAAMFRSVMGTWLPFAAIFAASWAAGLIAIKPAGADPATDYFSVSPPRTIAQSYEWPCASAGLRRPTSASFGGALSAPAAMAGGRNGFVLCQVGVHRSGRWPHILA